VVAIAEAMVWESETESTALASGAFATEVSEVGRTGTGASHDD
jgi:hypothetical protein